MNIVDVLMTVQQKVKNDEVVSFTGDDLNTLADYEQLRTLKLYIKFPIDFVKSTSLDECKESIRTGDSLYRTLEFCVKTNRVLEAIVYALFPQFK